MRLRILLLGLFLVGLSGSGNQVPTPTGYITVTFGAGLKLFANHLKVGTNRVASIIPEPVEGTELYTFGEGGFSTNRFSSGVWTNPDQRLESGEGAILFNPSGRAFKGTFWGEIPVGNLLNQVPKGLSLKCSLVPQIGGVTSTLGLRLAPFDNLYLWKSNQFEIYTFLADDTWFPAEPVISIGESFFIRANQPVNWTRSFTIH